MKRAAIGVRMHSGWGALVVVSNQAGKVEVIERRRLTIVASGNRGGKQPYHFAKRLELSEAEKFLEEFFLDSTRRAATGVRNLLDEIGGQYQIVGSALLLASGRPLPALPRILAAHPLIHTAEGEFFRQAFSKGCESLKVPVTGFRERGLDECVKTTLGKSAARIRRQISTLGRSLGPPWTSDQKMASLAALIVLATKQK